MPKRCSPGDGSLSNLGCPRRPEVEMGLLGSYPPVPGHRLNDDDVLAECHNCAKQKMMTREFVAVTAVVPRCQDCDGDVWLWIRGGTKQYESQAPRIVFQWEGKAMRWSKGL